jgi:hypothetical protein
MYYSTKQKGAITTTIIILKQDQASPPLAAPPLAVAPPPPVFPAVGPPRANRRFRLCCKISMRVKFHHSFVNSSINDGSIITVLFSLAMSSAMAHFSSAHALLSSMVALSFSSSQSSSHLIFFY